MNTSSQPTNADDPRPKALRDPENDWMAVEDYARSGIPANGAEIYFRNPNAGNRGTWRGPQPETELPSRTNEGTHEDEP